MISGFSWEENFMFFSQYCLKETGVHGQESRNAHLEVLSLSSAPKSNLVRFSMKNIVINCYKLVSFVYYIILEISSVYCNFLLLEVLSKK